MKITVTFIRNNQSVNYQLDDDMKIKDTLTILQESDNFLVEGDINYVFSNRLQESVSTEFTFKQARIYTGDEIKIGK